MNFTLLESRIWICIFAKLLLGNFKLSEFWIYYTTIPYPEGYTVCLSLKWGLTFDVITASQKLTYLLRKDWQFWEVNMKILLLGSISISSTHIRALPILSWKITQSVSKLALTFDVSSKYCTSKVKVKIGPVSSRKRLQVLRNKHENRNSPNLYSKLPTCRTFESLKGLI